MIGVGYLLLLFSLSLFLISSPFWKAGEVKRSEEMKYVKGMRSD
jgi:hypothetical protein